MKDNLEEIDKLISETLTQEEAKFYHELEEKNLLGSVKSTFKGKLGWLMIIMTILQFIILAALIYCVVQFFNTEETNELIKWSLGIFISGMMMSMLKLFSWMQMDKNTVMREIKRLELLVSSLSHK